MLLTPTEKAKVSINWCYFTKSCFIFAPSTAHHVCTKIPSTCKLACLMVNTLNFVFTQSSLEGILSDLTDDDIRMIMETEDEVNIISVHYNVLLCTLAYSLVGVECLREFSQQPMH